MMALAHHVSSEDGGDLRGGSGVTRFPIPIHLVNGDNCSTAT